jgi:hypothetical protein
VIELYAVSFNKWRGIDGSLLKKMTFILITPPSKILNWGLSRVNFGAEINSETASSSSSENTKI